VNSADTIITVNELLARYGAHEKMAIWYGNWFTHHHASVS
jgi:hypothetical protein